MANRDKLVKSVLGSILAKEIFKIRLDTMWKMLYLDSKGNLPSPTQEGATGRFDNKGAIFVPGGFLIEDSDKRLLKNTTRKLMSNGYFIKQIHQALNFDNATLIYPKGVEYGINLPNGFFIEKSSKILGVKEIYNDARLEKPVKFFSDNITTSLTPHYMLPPFGTRTKVSSCLSVCINNPRLYYIECSDNFGVRLLEQEQVWKKFKRALKPIKSNSRDILHLPYIMVLHDTRYTVNNLVGITRFLALNSEYDYAVLTFEKISNELKHELSNSNDFLTSSKLVADYNNTQVTPVLRFYTKEKSKLAFSISPKKDLGIKIGHIKKGSLSVYQEKY